MPEPGVGVDHLLLGRPRSAKSEMEVTTEGVAYPVKYLNVVRIEKLVARLIDSGTPGNGEASLMARTEYSS